MKNHVPSYNENLVNLRSQLSAILPAESLEVFNEDATQLAETHNKPLKVSAGDPAPQFALSNAAGNTVSLAELLQAGPVVLTFYRGAWCPYCNLQLNLYQQMLDQIKSAGASLVAISPQRPDQSLSMAEKNALQFEVLSDPGNQVAVKYTTVFKNADAPLAEMSKLGIDFTSFYTDASNGLPVPAVFIIDSNGIIRFAKAESGDYRLRVEPAEILDALDQLGV
ncbi:MAG: peroxiredoxin-like family protein [Mucilaginibacter sp.]